MHAREGLTSRVEVGALARTLGRLGCLLEPDLQCKISSYELATDRQLICQGKTIAAAGPAAALAYTSISSLVSCKLAAAKQETDSEVLWNGHYWK